MSDCKHEMTQRNISENEQCADCGSIKIRLDPALELDRYSPQEWERWRRPRHAIWLTLDDPRGCYAYMGYLGQSLHCGIHGLCAKCREWTGDAPSEVALENRRKELDRWMRAELPGLGLSDADVLSATETSYRAFFWWALDRVRTRNGLPGGHFRDSQGEKPRPELVRVRRDTDPSFENIVALGPVQS